MIVHDRKTYFDNVRASLFAGSMKPQQVKGQDGILNAWEDQQNSTDPMTDLRYLAYQFATTFHETAQRCWPIEEFGKGRGKPYGKPDENGNIFFGRGFVQLTWKENYVRATEKLNLFGDRDLGLHPKRALDLDIATAVMFRGMREGWFTGKKLLQYFDHDTNDAFNARDIINPDKNRVVKGVKMGDLIAGYHNKFLAALEASAREAGPPPVPAPENPKVLIDITVPVGIDPVVTINGIAVV